MKRVFVIGKVVRELLVKSNLERQPHKLPPFNPQHQLWKRGYVTTSYISEQKVKVTSRDMIKPLYPTLAQNKSVHLSLIDQIAPSLYISIVLFYQNVPNNNHPLNYIIEQRSKLLKDSLSKVLIDFYPLAGRIQKNKLINCSDEGAEFCEAHASKNLLQFIENPSLSEIQDLLPFQGAPRHKNIVLSIQANHFACGGMAIGVCLSHKIADAGATINFLKAWSAKAINDDPHIPLPKFNGASLFPPLKELHETVHEEPFISQERIAMRRLIFDNRTIREIKAQAGSVLGETIMRPTTVEVLTAFLCKHLPAVSAVKHFVNLRTRMVPPIQEDFFGNFVCFTGTTSPINNPEDPQFMMIAELRKAFTKIDDNYIRQLFFSDNDFMLQLKETNDLLGSSEKCVSFSSMSKFGFYDVNFGMGRPIWVCPAATPYKNASLFLSTKCGQGVEAWICMLEEDIDMLDNSFSHLGYPMVKPVGMK